MMPRWFNLLSFSCCLVWCLGLVHGAQVYMELNGVRYSYNTDGVSHTSNGLSANYEQPHQHQQTETQHWPYPSTTARTNYPLSNGLQPKHVSYNNQWSWSQPALEHSAHLVTSAPQHATHLVATAPQHTALPLPSKPYNIDFATQQMAHTQHTDESGIVLGKYSYYDAAGYHELSYKAGAGIGFVVMGGNLAKPTMEHAGIPTHGHALGVA